MPKKYPIDKSFGIFAKFSPPFGRCAFALARAALPCMPKGLRGTMHGYDIVRRSPITQENLAKRIAALRAAFAHEGK